MYNIEKKYSLLFVDDEKRILTALRSIFRRDYNVYIANSGQEALDILAQNDINVIVSDQRMPEMLGNELLAEVHKRYPNTMRLLLTGFMDTEAIIKTINESEIFRFINKPWRNDEIHEIVAEAALASEFTLSEAASPKPSPSSVSSTSASTASTIDSRPDQGILMMGNSQELRNQIRHLCRQNDINVYGTQSIPQAVGVVSARPAIGVSIIELPTNISEALQAINLLKKKRPELISIILTDETDADVAVELINSGQVFRYLQKPLATEKLSKTIEQAFIRHNVLKNNEAAQKRFKVSASQRLTAGIKDLFSSFGLSQKHV